ncbi:MAG: hypothetical protein ABF248_03045 [Yoonia sp.]
MSKFIVGTFLMLGFGFYQLSGGADFEPEVRALETAVISKNSSRLFRLMNPLCPAPLSKLRQRRLPKPKHQ